MAGCRQAYHLAAFARVWAKDPAIFYKINVEGTKNVLDAAREARVEKLCLPLQLACSGRPPQNLFQKAINALAT